MWGSPYRSHWRVGPDLSICYSKLRHHPVVETAQSTRTRAGSHHHLPESGSDGAAGDGDGGGCGEAGEGVPGAGVSDVPDPRHRPRPPHLVAAHGALRPRRQPRGARRTRPRALLRRSPGRGGGGPLPREQRHRVAGPDNSVTVPHRPSPSLGFD